MFYFLREEDGWGVDGSVCEIEVVVVAVVVEAVWVVVLVGQTRVTQKSFTSSHTPCCVKRRCWSFRFSSFSSSSSSLSEAYKPSSIGSCTKVSSSIYVGAPRMHISVSTTLVGGADPTLVLATDMAALVRVCMFPFVGCGMTGEYATTDASVCRTTCGCGCNCC